MFRTPVRRSVAATVLAALWALSGIPSSAPPEQSAAGSEGARHRQTAGSTFPSTKRPVGVPFTEYKMVSRKLVSSSYTNLSDLLANCKSNGGTCTISKSEAATRSIGLALGASRGWAAAQLTISASATRTLGISCTSPVLTSKQVWKAYPLGKRWSYKIRSQRMAWDEFGPAYPIGPATTSGTLYAFEPTGVACRL